MRGQGFSLSLFLLGITN